MSRELAGGSLLGKHFKLGIIIVTVILILHRSKHFASIMNRTV